MSRKPQVPAARVANVPVVEFTRRIEGKSPPTLAALARLLARSSP